MSRLVALPPLRMPRLGAKLEVAKQAPAPKLLADLLGNALFIAAVGGRVEVIEEGATGV
jgi:hypothetical protein